MALKRQFDMSATFSMASMTDVIFLLLIFFMVTSTFVFPNALEVNLPESSAQTTLKPSARIYLNSEGRTATMYGEGADWQMLDSLNSVDQLKAFFEIVRQQETEENPTSFVALYADREVPYGRVVEMLNAGAENNVRIVLATAAPANE
ncbi:MAG: biopolymer transporter ExbD [Muribaculaceae bacterium]|nr:biopolymer transporter ExbD [Muribaculaceae bacterium]